MAPFGPLAPAAGSNAFGQLGIDQQSSAMITKFMQIFASRAKAVAAGGEHSLILKHDGSVWATGWNMFDQLGDGSKRDRHVFVRVISKVAKTMTAGTEHSMVLKQEGSV